jgi:hypothetical protein
MNNYIVLLVRRPVPPEAGRDGHTPSHPHTDSCGQQRLEAGRHINRSLCEGNRSWLLVRRYAGGAQVPPEADKITPEADRSYKGREIQLPYLCVMLTDIEILVSLSNTVHQLNLLYN